MDGAEAPEPTGGAGVGADDTGPVPPDIAARIVRAVDRSPSSVVTLVNPDLTIAWVSQSARWVTGSDPDSRRGDSAVARIHPDDAHRLAEGLAQLRAARGHHDYLTTVPEPIRYRFQRFDGTWVVMEATIHNLLGDPEADGLLVFARPVSGHHDGVGHVIDLLVAGRPLPEVLGACAGLVPEPFGAAAVVALLPDGPVVGVPEGSPAAELVGDRRWWQAAAAGEPHIAPGFEGVPPDAAAAARARGFRSVWALPIRDQVGRDVIGCTVVWLKMKLEPNIATDEVLRHTERLASLVIGEERRRQDLRRQATTDPLTRLANRSAFEMRLAQAEGPVSVAVLDLDRFKPVNDSYGHEVGDAVLRVVAERLALGVRRGDLAARIGGDEFAVVFAEGTDHDDAVRSAARVVAAIEGPIALEGGRRVSVGASVGVATAPADEVVQRADAALYRAKRDKRAGRTVPVAAGAAARPVTADRAPSPAEA